METYMSSKITLDFTQDEALVLFHWIKNFNEKENNEFEDQSEERVLWDIESSLEKKLIEPFKGNYKELLLKARVNVRDAE